jgi:hypothetical protein
MLTLDQVASQDGYNGLEKGAIKMFTQVSPVLDIMPFNKIAGDSITWRREASLPGTAWRPVGGTYTASEGRIDAFTERLMILGGEVTADNFVIATQGAGENAIDIKASHYSLKAQAVANAFDQAFFEGDDLVDPNSMVGLRRRLSGAQVLNFGATAGTTLTLAQLQQLRDTVPFANAAYFMNRRLRRKVTELIEAQTGSGRIEYTQDSFGRQVVMYADTPIYIVERTGDGSTMLDFDEDPGDGSSDTASIYCVSFGSDAVHGIYNSTMGGKMVEVTDFGEIQAAPRHLGRIEFYPGMAIKHPRAAARLRAVNNA